MGKLKNGFSGWSLCNHKCPQKWKRENQRDCYMRKTWLDVLALKLEEGNFEPSNMGSL
jgi:hypothetical protein